MTASIFRDIDAFRDRIAVIEPSSGEFSYGDLLNRADAVGAAARGGSLALIVCKNSIDCLAGYVGLSRAGIPALLVHHGIKPQHLTDIIARFRPTYVYAPRAATVGGETFVSGDYALVSTGHEPGFQIHGDLGLLLGTSGTTGSRKFVRLSWANVASNASSIAEYLAIKGDDRAITTMPMSYSYGLSIVNSHLVRGAALVMTEVSLVSPDFWAAVRAHRVTTFGGVPFIYEMLKKLRFDRMDLPSLRVLTQAGGRLDPKLIAEFADICARKGIAFIVMYGQTEATARISYLPWESACAKIGSIGVAIPGGSLALVDEGGREIKENRVPGELLYRGENVSMGYAEGWADLALGDENRGVLSTGDIALRDEDGFFFITGRKKRFLKVYGNRVNLDEVERILQEQGFTVACTGTDDHLVVHVSGGADPAAVKAVLRDAISVPPNAVRAVAVDGIPRSESGKIDYAALARTA